MLVKKAKVRGNPVAISLFRDEIPAGYELLQEPPCSIVRFAMDEGKNAVLMPISWKMRKTTLI